MTWEEFKDENTGYNKAATEFGDELCDCGHMRRTHWSSLNGNTTAYWYEMARTGLEVGTGRCNTIPCDCRGFNTFSGDISNLRQSFKLKESQEV